LALQSQSAAQENTKTQASFQRKWIYNCGKITVNHGFQKLIVFYITAKDIIKDTHVQ